MKSTFYALIIMLSISITNHATADDKPLTGNAEIDSLLKELPKMKQDTNAVNLLHNLSFTYYSVNPDKGIEYGEQGLKLAEKIGWKKGESLIYNSLGVNNYVKSDYPKALEYYNKALIINEKINNKSWIANNLGNMASIYDNQSDYPKALEYYGKALKIFEELGDKYGIAGSLNNIGIIYMYQSDYPKALEYYSKALIINEEIDNKSWIANNLGNMGGVYLVQSDYPKALEYSGKALKIHEELGDKGGIAVSLTSLGNVYRNQSDYPKALEYYGKALKLDEDLGNKNGIAYKFVQIGGLYLTLSQDSVNINPSELNEFVSLDKQINLNKAIEYSLEAINIYEEIGELANRSKSFKTLFEAYEIKGDYKKAYEAHIEFKTLQDSAFNKEKSKQIAALEKAREDDVNRITIEKQEVQLVAQEKEKNFIIYSSVGGILSILIILGVIFNQRRKSDKLLLNILPAKIAKRLKGKEKTIADDIDSATTVFIDLVGFTSFAKDKKASEVVKMLNGIFSRFDKLVSDFGLEKIKTMGDGYMAAAGVLEATEDHAKKAVDFAIAVREEIDKFNQGNGLTLNARIGLESGPLVAGVIGSSKFIYDLWGDSVNTASRMESTGTPGKIQISENVKAELHNIENIYNLESRGEIEIKGKGKMNTYFIEERKVEVV